MASVHFLIDRKTILNERERTYQRTIPQRNPLLFKKASPKFKLEKGETERPEEARVNGRTSHNDIQ